MYAVIQTGGKQYRVSPGQTLEIELLPAEPGSEVALEEVLLVATDSNTIVGTPLVPGGRVIGTVIREGRGKKVLVFKFRAKKRYRRLNGHRQDYTYLTVTDIQANGESLVTDAERRRLERIARRAVTRFEGPLLEAGDSPEEDEPVAAVRTPARPVASARASTAPAPKTPPRAEATPAATTPEAATASVPVAPSERGASPSPRPVVDEVAPEAVPEDDEDADESEE